MARLCRSGRSRPPPRRWPLALPSSLTWNLAAATVSYALSEGIFPVGSPPATPALPNTGALVKVNGDGTFTVIMDGLDRPTSLEFIGNTAYFVTLTGEIWKINGVSCPP